jgi:ankyrin repeat protein
VAHSAANSTDQRSFVDRLFKAYPTLVAAAKDGDAAKVAALMDDVYVAAPDASTKKIRDAQVRAAALEAIESGKHTTLKALLDRGADLGIGESDGGDGGAGGALTRGAASAGHAVVLDVLLDTFGLEYMYFKDAKTGRTPLLCAAANGHEACVARVLARLMDAEERDDGRRATAVVDAVDVDGNTAAMLAAENDHAGCLNQLRGAGCDMEIARESDGATAMAIHRARVLSRIRCIED